MICEKDKENINLLMEICIKVLNSINSYIYIIGEWSGDKFNGYGEYYWVNNNIYKGIRNYL